MAGWNMGWAVVMETSLAMPFEISLAATHQRELSAWTVRSEISAATQLATETSEMEKTG